MYRRNIHQRIATALRDTPVVLVQGARQTGKTTLVQALAAEGGTPRRYVTLDDANMQAAARSDPEGFLQGFREGVALDEVQHAPALFPAIKRAVDGDRRPGRFLLTGSANVLLLPRLSESLAGRMEIVPLAPLSQGECEGQTAECISALFAHGPLHMQADGAVQDLWERVLAGGFPEVLTRAGTRRRDWFAAYITTLLQRDVRDFANIEGVTLLPRLLQLLATRTAGLMNVADISRALAVPYTTLSRYLALLEALFLVNPLPPWTTNLGKRLVKAQKLFFVDSGLVGDLLGCDVARLQQDGTLRGALFEQFVVGEIAKQASWSPLRPALFHFRTQAGQEVDLVLERPSGEIVGLEMKAAASVRAEDFRGLQALAALAGSRFQRGVVLYTGREPIAFGPALEAIPVGWLWRG